MPYLSDSAYFGPSGPVFNPLTSSLTNIYDADSGVTTATGVSAWAPVKGSSSLAQGTAANQPAYLTNQYNGHNCVSSDGVNDSLLFSGLSAASGSQYFCFVIESDFTGANNYLFDTSAGRLLFGSITGQQLSWSDGTGHSVGTRPTGLAIIEWIFNSGGNGQIYVNGYQAGSTFAESAYTAKAIGGTSRLFSHNNGLGNWVAAKVAWFAHQAGMPSVDTRCSLINYLASRYGISSTPLVAPVGTLTVIAADGDSLTAGFGITTAYPSRLTASGLFLKNFSGSGATVAQMDPSSPYRIGNMLIPSTVTAKKFLFLGGTNDLLADTAATTEARISTYLSRSWTSSWRRILLTLPAHTNATRNGKTITLNNLLRAASYKEALADTGAIAEYNPNTAGVTSNTTYYLVDGVHWTQTGVDTKVAPVVQAQL